MCSFMLDFHLHRSKSESQVSYNKVKIRNGVRIRVIIVSESGLESEAAEGFHFLLIPTMTRSLDKQKPEH